MVRGKIIANLKMNIPKKFNYNKDIIICPGDIYLKDFVKMGYKVCSQNVSSFEDGSHTGSTSIQMLRDIGVNYALIGHYETRRDFRENEDDLNKKIKLCLKNNIEPFLCIGEHIGEDVSEYILNELHLCLDGINHPMTIIYEPVWSIGTGVTPTSDNINYVIKIIKDNYPDFKVLYGGSVTTRNIDVLKKIHALDGVIVGKDSLDPDKINYIREVF